jgi:phytoene dehydrogenase-like protein
VRRFSTTSLVKLAEDIGVNFVYNSPVEEILVDTLQKKKSYRSK